jgi:transketolase
MEPQIREMRQKILETSHAAKSGHIASAFSILEILHVLYDQFLKDEDSFILSKGHGSLGLYAVLWNKGFITDEQMGSFGKYDSILGGHPDRNKVPKVVASTGSLGHGLPVAVGLAFAKLSKLQRGKVYCLVGDGECNEGSVWEAALLAKHLRLNNLVCIVDNNKSQIRSVPTEDVQQKFSSFGFRVISVDDGHDTKKLRDAILLSQDSDVPTCIVCDTVKGYGIDSISSDMFSWHHRSPNADELSNFLKELSL